MVTTKLRITVSKVSKFNRSPPLLNDEKKDGPTCSPIKNTNKISPKSRTNDNTVGLTVKPTYPQASPTARYRKF